MEQPIRDLLKKTQEDLKEVGFDFYSLVDNDGIILYVSYSTERKRFVVTVIRADPAAILMAIPVDINVAESKSTVVFGRDFFPYIVYEGEKAGDIRIVKSPRFFIGKSDQGSTPLTDLLSSIEGSE